MKYAFVVAENKVHGQIRENKKDILDGLDSAGTIVPGVSGRRK